MTLPRERVLTAADGTQLFVTDWIAGSGKALPKEGPPLSTIPKTVRGGVVIMHGLGEHCGRYLHVARFFNELGWSVRTYDHRGHGRSGGARGDTPNDDAIVQDAKLVIDDFAQSLSQPPILLGHSLGGLFAARFATAGMSPLRALILSSPALAIPLSGVEKILLKTLSSVAPGFGVSNGVKARFLSHDKAVVDAYQDDPLVHSKISSRLLNSMLAAVDYAQSHANVLKIPVLMAVAGDDHLVDAKGSKQFFAHLTPGIGTLHWYDNLYHEIFNEADSRPVFSDVQTWLDRV